MTDVVNMEGTSHRKCTCPNGDGTWLGHWALGAGVVLAYKGLEKCCAKYCSSYAEVGAHVKDVSSKGTPWIVPFCQYHNKRPASEIITLKDVMMVACAKVDCDQ